MAITSLVGRYLQDSYKFVTQNSQSYVSPDKWDFADGDAVPITWINATASWAATASVALGLADNIWVRSTGSNSAVLNDSKDNISVTYGTSSIAYGYRTTASGDFSQAQGSGSHALSIYSHAEGILVSASSLGSHAEGYRTVAGNEVLVTPAVPAFYTNVPFKATSAAGNLVVGSDPLTLKPYNSYWARFNTGDWIAALTNGYNQQNYTTATIGLVTVYYPAPSAYSMSLRLVYQNPPAINDIETLPIYAIYSETNGGFPGYRIITSIQPTVNPNSVEGVTSNPAIPQVPNAQLATAFTPFTPAVFNYTGSYSHTEGYGTKTLGIASHAEGIYTTASGHYSHAEGSASISYGTASHAEGLHTIASASFQTVVGRYNRHNNTDDYFVVGDGTMDIPISRSNALGVNATRFYASNSIFFPDLTDSFKQHLVVFDTASGQLFYYTASGLGGGAGIPGGPHGSIQFNSASTFSGSGYLTYNFQNSQLILTGSQVIDLSGSATALQIINDCSGQSSELVNLPFLHRGIRNNWVGGPENGLWIPSGSFGQYWSLSAQHGFYIFDITSSNGDLRFRGSIGKTVGVTPLGRHGNTAIYADNIGYALVTNGQFSYNRVTNTTIYAYSSSVIGAQPIGFTASIAPADNAYDLSLISYTSSLIAADGSGIGTGLQPAGVAIPGDSVAGANRFEYTPSGSGLSKVHYYSYAAQYSSSKGNAGSARHPAGTPLSASYAAWRAAGADITTIQSVGEQVPIGFFMSTFEQNNPVTQSVEISTEISQSGINVARFVEYRAGVPTDPVICASTFSTLYNPITERIYVAVQLPGPHIVPGPIQVRPGGTLAIVELDNTTSPPTVTNVSDMYGGSVPINNPGFLRGWAINPNNGDIVLLSAAAINQSRLDFYDGNTLNIDFNDATFRKATYTITDFNPSSGRILFNSSSFYCFAGKYIGTTNSSHQLKVMRVDSGSSGYTITTSSYQTSYHSGTSGNYQGVGMPAYVPTIDKIIATDMSDVGPVGDVPTNDEVPPLTFASNHKVYTVNTSSLDLSATFTPFEVAVNRVGNFVEFIDCTGDVLSYVDANGVFQGTASFAANVLPGGSSVEFYSGSVLQTSNLEGLVISGSYLQSQANGNQVTMSIDLSSILATFTSQSFTTPATSWTFNHNLNERHPLITVYDNNHEVIIPQDVIATNNNTVTITFSSNTTGYAVAGAGPFTGLTRYPISFYSSSTLQTADLRSLVITGSGVTSTLNGNQITMSFSGGGGSANPGGANTNIQFNYNGNALSGSNNFTFISQSNTVLLSGSLIVSNSLNVIGTSRVTGSNIVSGSWQLIGTGNVTGSLIVSNSLNVIGTSRITGSLIVSNSLNLIGTGSVTGSLRISGSTNVIGTSSFTGSVSISGSTFLRGLTNTSQTEVLTYNTSTGQVFFTASSQVGTTVRPDGSNTHVQYNNNGLFGGDSDFTYDTNTNFVTVPSLVINTTLAYTNIVNVNSSTYSINDTDHIVLVDYSGTTTITLPTANRGRTVVIKDIGYRLSPTGDVISFTGTSLESGLGGYQMENPGECIRLLYNDASNEWYIISKFVL